MYWVSNVTFFWVRITNFRINRNRQRVSMCKLFLLYWRFWNTLRIACTVSFAIAFENRYTVHWIPSGPPLRIQIYLLSWVVQCSPYDSPPVKRTTRAVHSPLTPPGETSPPHDKLYDQPQIDHAERNKVLISNKTAVFNRCNQQTSIRYKI